MQIKSGTFLAHLHPRTHPQTPLRSMPLLAETEMQGEKQYFADHAGGAAVDLLGNVF